jgi:hypothetical protein
MDSGKKKAGEVAGNNPFMTEILKRNQLST